MYVADENGFRATGDHLPVSPAVSPVQLPAAFPSVYPMIPVPGYGYRYSPQNYYPFYYPSFVGGRCEHKFDSFQINVMNVPPF